MHAALPPEDPASNEKHPGDEAPAGQAPETPPDDRPEEPLWSPPQFGLKTILILTALWAALLALARVAGNGVAYGVVALALFAWLVTGLVRLVRP